MRTADSVSVRALLRRRRIVFVDDRLLALDLVEIFLLGLHSEAAKATLRAQRIGKPLNS
jgi:hypothetical protein